MIVTSRDKPLPRAGEGTVMRSQALDLYSREIADLCVYPLSPINYVVVIFFLDIRPCRTFKNQARLFYPNRGMQKTYNHGFLNTHAW